METAKFCRFHYVMAQAMKAKNELAPAPNASRGCLRVRLAQSPDDVRAAQRLRFEVFHDEMGARLPQTAVSMRMDVDAYDAIADHLLVEHETAGGLDVVGTYRLLRQSVADSRGGFYTSGEFDLSALLEHAHDTGGSLLELGRSCVAPAFRNSATIQLLWRGIADYLDTHHITHMFGCASFHGTDPSVHAEALSHLHHHLLAPPHLRARALPAGCMDMNMLALGSYDRTAALRGLPPLVKGYLRVGALVGDGAWIDEAFGTIDIFVVMPVDTIASRYSSRFTGFRIAA